MGKALRLNYLDPIKGERVDISIPFRTVQKYCSLNITNEINQKYLLDGLAESADFSNLSLNIEEIYNFDEDEFDREDYKKCLKTLELVIDQLGVTKIRG